MFKFIIPKKYHEWISQYKNLKEKEIFIVHDCRKPLPFPDGSVDHILCSHFLEHVFLKEMEEIISDFYRVLKNGGTLHVIVPNIHWIINEYLLKKRSSILNAADWFLQETILSRETRGSIKYRMLEFFGMFGLQHRWMYDYNSMESNLKKLGFTILKENNSPSKNYQLDTKYKAVNILAKKTII